VVLAYLAECAAVAVGTHAAARACRAMAAAFDLTGAHRRKHQSSKQSKAPRSGLTLLMAHQRSVSDLFHKKPLNRPWCARIHLPHICRRDAISAWQIQTAAAPRSWVRCSQRCTRNAHRCSCRAGRKTRQGMDRESDKRRRCKHRESHGIMRLASSIA
jgi:hypothetical protein